MSGTAIVIIKLMPESPSVDLQVIQSKARDFMVHHGAMSVTMEEQSVAFGLKAIIIKAAVPEDKGTDFFEQGLAHIQHVSSVTIEDYRRAFG